MSLTPGISDYIVYIILAGGYACSRHSAARHARSAVSSTTRTVTATTIHATISTTGQHIHNIVGGPLGGVWVKLKFDRLKSIFLQFFLRFKEHLYLEE